MFFLSIKGTNPGLVQTMSKKYGISHERAFIKHFIRNESWECGRSAASGGRVDVFCYSSRGMTANFQVKATHKHKYVRPMATKAAREIEKFPIGVVVWCGEHRNWIMFDEELRPNTPCA